MSQIRSASPALDSRTEWLETDGLGGFAMGTTDLVRTRRYHGLLVVAARPPTARTLLVAGVEIRLLHAGQPTVLSQQHYAPGLTLPAGPTRVKAFAATPWPCYQLRLDQGAVLHYEIAQPRSLPAVLLRWRAEGLPPGARLHVRPLLAARDVHALQREDAGFRMEAKEVGACTIWQPYEHSLRICAWSDGRFQAEPYWYRRFLYTEERARGYDCEEDLAAPGEFVFDLGQGEGRLLLAGAGALLPELAHAPELPVRQWLDGLFEQEARRRACQTDPLQRAADHYLVQRGAGLSVIAGYPWFTDWGRDTFLSLRGLLLAPGRLTEAGAVLATWAQALDQGMLPNRFVEHSETAEYHSVDAPLWFAICAHEYLQACAEAGQTPPAAQRELVQAALQAILENYARGTRYGIALDEDGLLSSGQSGWQLTWMDAKVGAEVITPRSGKPVEVQALWIHALAAGATRDRRWREIELRARRNFASSFWYEDGGYLYDVIDVAGCRGERDASLRPNQILALGGLATPLLENDRARRVVDCLEQHLWTPLGLRTLDPRDPRYIGRYAGAAAERDRAYHQGSAWLWLAGPFIEAWVRVRGNTASARELARQRFLAPLLAHLQEAGLGHLSELADGDAPHRPAGAPFQAWSLAELLRVRESALAEPVFTPGALASNQPSLTSGR